MVDNRYLLADRGDGTLYFLSLVEELNCSQNFSRVKSDGRRQNDMTLAL